MLDPKPSLWSPCRRLLGLNCSWCVLSTKLYSQRSICSRINIVDCQFRVITKMFGNFWTNVVILVNFWSFNPLHVQVAQALMRQKFILLVRFAQKFIKGCQLSSKNVTTRLRYDDILHVQIARICI